MSKYHLSIYEKGLYPKGKRKCIVLHMFQVGDMSNSPASLRPLCVCSPGMLEVTYCHIWYMSQAYYYSLTGNGACPV